MSQLIVHPKIASLNRRLDQIDELYIVGQYAEAWNIMLTVISGLKPEDIEKSRELVEGIKQSINYVKAQGGLTPAQLHIRRREAENIYILSAASKHKEQFNKLIWDGQYLSNEGYGLVATAGDRVSGQSDFEGLPETMSSEVE